ncbi:hypothetical protein BDN71DRAFT_1455531 [Pleurotus eryngii]|uniref:Uncharacterized protein n=1 Tax=Pleurotus eryngii TaxID=5323 RepID=A0A9P5ZKL6_PLEER|nr:hypothetical protein BDN71DRAFT_1455531 [Pleurotus eryngii]
MFGAKDVPIAWQSTQFARIYLPRNARRIQQELQGASAGHSTSPAENLGLTFLKRSRTRTSSTLRTYKLANGRNAQACHLSYSAISAFEAHVHSLQHLGLRSVPHRHSFLCIDQDPFFRALGSCCSRHIYRGFCVSARGTYPRTAPTLARLNVIQTLSTLVHKSPFSVLSLASAAQW